MKSKALVTRRLLPEAQAFLEKNLDIKIIANCAVGFNNIDVAYAKEKGILVTNTPGVLTDTTAALNLIAGLGGETPPNLVVPRINL